MRWRERLHDLGEKEREIWSHGPAREAAMRPLFALLFPVFLCRVGLATAFQRAMISALAPVHPASRKKKLSHRCTGFLVGCSDSIRHDWPFLTWPAQPQGVAHTDRRKLGWVVYLTRIVHSLHPYFSLSCTLSSLLEWSLRD